MKMIDGVVDLNSNVLELFGLAINLISSNLQIRGLLRNLDNKDDYDDVNYFKEKDDKEDNIVFKIFINYVFIFFKIFVSSLI